MVQAILAHIFAGTCSRLVCGRRRFAGSADAVTVCVELTARSPGLLELLLLLCESSRNLARIYRKFELFASPDPSMQMTVSREVGS
jgi:hypothetical protein